MAVIRPGLKIIYKTHASQTPEGRKRAADYHTALGYFVASFSRAEVAVQTVLRYYAKLPANRAHILFSGTRADAGIDLIKNLALEGGMAGEEYEKLSGALAQLRAINTTRNAILHYGAQDVYEAQPYVRKALYGVDAKKVKVTEFPIATSELDAMTADLQSICMFLYVGHAGRPAPKGGFSKDAILRLFASPWHYTPPQPRQSQSRSKVAQRPAKPRAKQPRQPRPSGEKPVNEDF